jgi:hypothetical protein
MNYQTDLVFLYVAGTRQFPRIAARSAVVAEKAKSAALFPRLAQRGGNTHVTWTQCGPKGGIARVRDGSRTREVSAWLEEKLAASDMCDREVAPAANEGWLAPCLQRTADLGALRPRTAYRFSVGRDDERSEEVAFQTGPAAGTRTRLAMFGDMGQAIGVQEHDFLNLTGEVGAVGVAQQLRNLIDAGSIDAVVHFGDISYATGYLAEWTNFLDLISPVASRVPWQASIGNHELGWSKSLAYLNTSEDSGGECGVPFRAYFPLSTKAWGSPGARVPLRDREDWYDFRIGNAAIFMLSSETDVAEGSPQGAWLRDALPKVDRAVTPWVVVTIHRPVLLSSVFDGDFDMARRLQRDLVPFLEAQRVDIVLSGHHHSYQRNCRSRAGRCSGSGIWTFVLGAAGYPLAPAVPDAPYLEKKLLAYGIGLFDFQNATHAAMEFVDRAGAVRDSAWLVREAEPMIV